MTPPSLLCVMHLPSLRAAYLRLQRRHHHPSSVLRRPVDRGHGHAPPGLVACCHETSRGWPSARAGVDLSHLHVGNSAAPKLTAGPWFLTPSCSGPSEVCRGMIHHVHFPSIVRINYIYIFRPVYIFRKNIFQYIGCQIESKIHILIFTVPTKY